MTVVPTMTLSRPAPHGPRDFLCERAVGNDGLTDAEREDLARQYRTVGGGRQPSRATLDAADRWLAERRAARLA